jgi:hypothetical protein
MTNIHERLRAAASQNAQLLQTLSETGYSVAAYQQNQSYISILKKQITEQEKKLAEINRTTEKEYSDHKKYRDSHMKRLAYKLGGKKEAFLDRATKEEKEWLDAVAMQLAAKNALEKLNTELSEATKQGAGLLDIVNVHNGTALELDALYNSIFKGPTPSMPIEDAKEKDVIAAEREFNMLQLMLSNEKQASQILREAEKFMQRALFDAQEAKSNSTLDAWGVGGTWVEIAEQSSLSTCQQHVSQTEMLVSQAMRLQPQIQPIGSMQVAQMNFMSDILFDNIFTDLDMRDRIIDSLTQIQQASDRLKQQIRLQHERVDGVAAEVTHAQNKLKSKREELQVIRREAFERLAEDEDYSIELPEGPPPSYVEAS